MSLLSLSLLCLGPEPPLCRCCFGTSQVCQVVVAKVCVQSALPVQLPFTVAPVVSHVQTLMRGLLDAVAHMHAHGISHRDLKLENLVFGRAGDLSTVTIVDFGLAKAARARERMHGVTGTLWYTAPEILKGVPYSPVVDVWSLGVVMYLILTGASRPLLFAVLAILCCYRTQARTKPSRHTGRLC